jgi:hypothetical protein
MIKLMIVYCAIQTGGMGRGIECEHIPLLSFADRADCTRALNPKGSITGPAYLWGKDFVVAYCK